MPLVSQSELIEKAIAAEIVSFPTDTVPALAVLPEKSESIFKLKKRSQEKPLILMAASIEELWQYVKGTAEELEIWQTIAKKYLPGALTLVLPASDKVSPKLNPNDPTTIGIRVPNHTIAQQILKETGALATTSANISGQPALINMKEIASNFPQVFVLNHLQIQTNITPSTVIKWRGKDWQLLRQGKIELN